MVEQSVRGGVLRQLVAEGVSPWIEGTERTSFESGAVARLIAQGVVRGATSDPATVAAAMSEGDAYSARIRDLAATAVDVDSAVSTLLAEDARAACDALRPIFESTDRHDGYVSVDLDPSLMHDSIGTLACARRVVRDVNRPNVLVKIPASGRGLRAVECCLAEGIGVHVTDVYSLRRHRATFDAFLTGLERAHAQGLPLHGLASVAALPVALIDRAADALLDGGADTTAYRLRGRTAIATACLMYREYDERMGSRRWRALRLRGAEPQRLLFSCVPRPGAAVAPGHYVAQLVAWGTVSAMTPAMLAAVDEHGLLNGDTLTGGWGDATALLAEFARFSGSHDEWTERLMAGSTARQAVAWQRLRRAVAEALGAA
jgi:transaldolase